AIAVWAGCHCLTAAIVSADYVLLELQVYVGVTPVMIRAVAAEVSERRRHEHKLERQATELTRLAAIVESSHDAIIAKTLEGTIVSWNAGAERICGYSASEAIGRSISMLAVSNPDEEMPAVMDRIRRGENV